MGKVVCQILDGPGTAKFAKALLDYDLTSSQEKFLRDYRHNPNLCCIIVKKPDLLVPVPLVILTTNKDKTLQLLSEPPSHS